MGIPAKAAVTREATAPPGIEDVTIGPLRSGEVLVRVSHAGICHTDLSCHAGLIPTRRPVVLGHEGAGVVVAVADDVHSVAVGTRVIMSLHTCGKCARCQAGDAAYCEQALGLNILGGGPGSDRTYDGSDVYDHFFGQSSFATHSIAHERNVVPIPDDVPAELAAPLGCGIMTGAGTVLNALRVRPGQRVAVFGTGAVGLAAIMAARLSGASAVVAVDMLDARLDVALEIGATDAVNAGDTDVVGQVRDAIGGADYAVEASGNSTALAQAIETLAPRGTCAVVGVGHGSTVAMDTNLFRIKGATLRGVSMGDANPQLLLPYLLQQVRAGGLPMDRLVTTYDFSDIAKAFDDAQAGRVVKPVLVMPTS